jgi:hypothetical protein
MDFGQPVSKRDLQLRFNPVEEQRKKEEAQKEQEETLKRQLEQAFCADFKVHIQNLGKIAEKGGQQYFLYLGQSHLFVDHPTYHRSKAYPHQLDYALRMCRQKFPDLLISSIDMNLGELRMNIHETYLRHHIQSELKKKYDARKELERCGPLSEIQLRQIQSNHLNGKFVILDWNS